ncbi:hypothetical protein [Actinokineospora sp. NPDC004072]
MAIDPMHLPIFGDPRPVQPPAEVRVAAALLLVQAGVTVAAVVRVSADPTFFALTVLLTLAFAYGARAGLDWARFAACFCGVTSLVLSIGLIEGGVELALVGASAFLVGTAARLLYRPQVQEFFSTADVDAG